jgi:hypothetical protein
MHIENDQTRPFFTKSDTALRCRWEMKMGIRGILPVSCRVDGDRLSLVPRARSPR